MSKPQFLLPQKVFLVFSWIGHRWFSWMLGIQMNPDDSEILAMRMSMLWANTKWRQSLNTVGSHSTIEKKYNWVFGTGASVFAHSCRGINWLERVILSFHTPVFEDGLLLHVLSLMKSEKKYSIHATVNFQVTLVCHSRYNTSWAAWLVSWNVYSKPVVDIMYEAEQGRHFC